MKGNRILPGTADWPRWTSMPNGQKGVQHYGRIKGAYKVPREDIYRLEAIGYRTVKIGSAYAYVTAPKVQP